MDTGWAIEEFGAISVGDGLRAKHLWCESC